ncbi:MAG: biopolymer transport protein ExbD, partial [Candidatus Krumholzibacteriia bacterium]
AFESSFAVGRAQTATEENSEEGLVPEVHLQILSDTEVRINGTTIMVAVLPEAVESAIAHTSNKNVAISCADEVSHGTFVQVMDIAKLSGATGIAVVEEETKRRTS